ncbi:hypothetical protein Aph01nite_12890 [Acrocarpospora phusangensis]|uniref:Uncharacterized protein n=1 Tax=Acrocarpospora phusangensis TaxID=1070424 RepID=A0A919Q5X2_9ACTN|nr:hypothetical protein [Acrocarpospora phusangensis]GIH22979.1 hypothetical protein Aph01nite_12890 [Acrocarpospora phusangensis]
MNNSMGANDDADTSSPSTDFAPDTSPVTWLTGDCPAWCDGLHAANEWGSDRLHMGHVGRVELLTMRFFNHGSENAPRYLPRAIEINLAQQYREIEPRLTFEMDLGAKEVPELSLTEAQSFIAALAAAIVGELPLDQAKRLVTSLGVTIAGRLIGERPERATPECPPWCEDHTGGHRTDDGACCRDLQGEYGDIAMTECADMGAPALCVRPASQELTVDQAEELARDLLLQVAAARLKDASDGGDAVEIE